jgi:hypothetical protein
MMQKWNAPESLPVDLQLLLFRSPGPATLPLERASISSDAM